MIARIWRTDFDPDRLDELRRFADEISAPMLGALPGCLGQVHANDGRSWMTITLWESRAHIEQAEASQRYRDTVDAILAAGFLRGGQTTDVFDITYSTVTGA